MKTFIQTASIDELRQLHTAGLVDGVALSMLDVTDLDPALDPSNEALLRDRIVDVAHEFAVPICAPVRLGPRMDVYRDGRELARLDDHLIVQVPFLYDTIDPIRRLVADGVRVCVTYVYNGAQAYLAGKTGATMVMVPVNDLEAHGRPMTDVVGEIRDVLDHSDLECELAVSAPNGSTQFTGCLLAGADIVCMTPPVMRALTTHALTDRGIDRFLHELTQRQYRPRGI